jgi:hypothetical protein
VRDGVIGAEKGSMIGPSRSKLPLLEARLLSHALGVWRFDL